MKYSSKLLFCLGFTLCLSVYSPSSLIAEQEIVIDSVIASVDGKPITLLELSRRMATPTLTAQQIAEDPEARQVLESIIFERMVEEEAYLRRIRVEDQEVNSYIDEIALKNQLPRDKFLILLKEKNIDETLYRQQIKFDITRTRLMSQIAQSGVGVTEKEIEQFVSENPTLSKGGAKVRLAQIFVSKESDSSVEDLVADIQEKLRNGDDFEDIQESFSQGVLTSELGVLREEDLSPQIFDAVLGLDEGETSVPVEMADGVRFFHLLERYKEEEKIDERLKDQVRAQLESRKLEEHVQAFFQSELAKNHSVDRKI